MFEKKKRQDEHRQAQAEAQGGLLRQEQQPLFVAGGRRGECRRNCVQVKVSAAKIVAIDLKVVHF